MRLVLKAHLGNIFIFCHLFGQKGQLLAQGFGRPIKT